MAKFEKQEVKIESMNTSITHIEKTIKELMGPKGAMVSDDDK